MTIDNINLSRTYIKNVAKGFPLKSGISHLDFINERVQQLRHNIRVCTFAGLPLASLARLQGELSPI